MLDDVLGPIYQPPIPPSHCPGSPDDHQSHRTWNMTRLTKPLDIKKIIAPLSILQLLRLKEFYYIHINYMYILQYYIYITLLYIHTYNIYMYLSLSGSEVNQYYHIIDAESLGHWAKTGRWTPRPTNRKTRRISPNLPASVRPTLCENVGFRYGERCAEHGKVMGKSLGEDEQKMELLSFRLQLLSFFFWLEESEQLDPILLSLVCDDLHLQG